MKTFFIVRDVVEYIVEGETSDIALMNFSEHGRGCQNIMHARSSARCIVEKIEAEDLLDAVMHFERRVKPQLKELRAGTEYEGREREKKGN